jgi:WD40 repeat protein
MNAGSNRLTRVVGRGLAMLESVGHEATLQLTVQRMSQGHVTSLAFDPEGRWLACSDSGGAIAVWDHDGCKLVANAQDDRITIWDLETGEQRLDRAGAGFVSFAASDRLIAVATRSGQVRIWDAATGVTVREYDAHFRPAEAVARSRDALDGNPMTLS